MKLVLLELFQKGFNIAQPKPGHPRNPTYTASREPTFENVSQKSASLREAFIRKNRKKFGVLPNPGGGVPPNQTISGFFLREKTFIALK